MRTDAAIVILLLGLAVACGEDTIEPEKPGTALAEPDVRPETSDRSQLPKLGDRASSKDAPAETGDEGSVDPRPLHSELDPGADGPLLSPPLRAWARRQIETAVRSERPSTPEHDFEALLEEFDRRVLALPSVLASDYLADQDRIEENERLIDSGEATQLMTRWAEAELELPADFDRTRSIVDRVLTPRPPRDRLSGPLVSPRPPDSEPIEIEDGTVVEYPPGVHRLDTSLSTFRQEWAADVTIRGAGMDATLLQLDSDFRMRGNVERLRIEDLTLDGRRDGVFDIRSGSLVLDLERVRIVGFDRGKGGSAIFATFEAPSLIRAHQCRFEGGYGKQGGGGHLSRLGARILASFSDCRFELFSLDLDQAERSRSRLLFQGCSFDRMRDDLSKRYSGVQLRDSHIGEAPDFTRIAEYRKNIQDLFPAAR